MARFKIFRIYRIFRMLLPRSRRKVKVLALFTFLLGVMLHTLHASHYWRIIQRIPLGKNDVHYDTKDQRCLSGVTTRPLMTRRDSSVSRRYNDWLSNKVRAKDVRNNLLQQSQILLYNKTRGRDTDLLNCSRTLLLNNVHAKWEVLRDSTALFSNKTWHKGEETHFLQHSYKLLTNNIHVCSSPKGDVDLFIIIMTQHNDFSLRSLIRDTWLAYSQNNTSNVRYVFIMANNGTGTISNDIQEEIEVNKDIVVFDFKDAYENLTLKTTLGLKYAASYCSDARFVMKTDSDVYVNIPSLLGYMSLYMMSDLRALGLLRSNATPIRTSNGLYHKWAVSFLEFSGSRYPSYLDGMGYVLPMRTVHALIDVFPSVRFFRFEDVYIGMCLEKIGARLQDSKGFIRTENVMPPCAYRSRRVYAMHGAFGRKTSNVWTFKCPVTDHLLMRKAGNIELKLIKYEQRQNHSVVVKKFKGDLLQNL